MTFLKKFGQILAKIGVIAASVGGIALPFFGSGKANQIAGTVVNDLTQIGSVVGQIEVALQGKSGPDKLQAAIALVGPIIRTSELVVGKKIANEALFTQAVQEITQGVVDLLNSLDASSVPA